MSVNEFKNSYNMETLFGERSPVIINKSFLLLEKKKAISSTDSSLDLVLNLFYGIAYRILQ